MKPPIYEPKGKAKEYGDLALNIYTGCPHRCYYCVDKDTPVLTADMRSVPIKDINIGDQIIGIAKEGSYHKFRTATVYFKATSVKEAYLIRLSDGTEIVCSGDHRWLTRHRGWKYTIGAMNGKDRRPYLTAGNEILGYGKAICNATPEVTDEYRRGYLFGIISGDGTIGHYDYDGRKIHGFRLAMKEKSAVDRTKDFLEYFGIAVHEFRFKNPNGSELPAIRSAGTKVSEIEKTMQPENEEQHGEYLRGFMAGLYDAEGASDMACRVYNSDENLLSLFERGLDFYGFSHKVEDYHQGNNGDVKCIRIEGGISEAVRFRQIADVAIHQKFYRPGFAIKNKENTYVVSVEKLGDAREMVDITTSTGNFIAWGCVAHNCFAPGVLHKEREAFHSHVEPRPGIVEEVRKQLEKEQITDKLIHLCFTCDPYPTGYDSGATREIIKLFKEYGNHVQILTKGDGSRDFDLLDENDWYGITLSSMNTAQCIQHYEPGAEGPNTRLAALIQAHNRGIKTWVSFEPVLDDESVLTTISMYFQFFDKVKIGKLNYHPSEIPWAEFGREAEAQCKILGLDYYIKDSLRAEMEKEK